MNTERQSFFVTDKFATVSDGGGFFDQPCRVTQFSLSDVVSVTIRDRRLTKWCFVIFLSVLVAVSARHFDATTLMGSLAFLAFHVVASALITFFAYWMFFRIVTHIVVVRTKSEKLRFKLSKLVASNFASELWKQLAESRDDFDSRSIASVFDLGVADLLLAVEKDPKNFLWLHELGLAKENGINCKRNVKEALEYFKRAHELHPCKGRCFAGFARCSVKIDNGEDLEISINSAYLDEDIVASIGQVTASIYADKLVSLSDEEALKLSFSGAPTSILSLLSLEEIPDSVAYRFSRYYEGRSIRLKPDVKMSAEASRMLGRLLDQRPV